MRPPNILFLMTDQHRFDALGYAGNEIVRTPVLDALAKGATVFENCYTPSPVCIPARQSMMAGQFPRTCGCERFGEDLPPFYDTFARRLAQVGYEAVCCGKLHHTGPDQMQGWTRRVAGDMQCRESKSPFAPEKAQQRWTTAKEIRRAGVGRHRHSVDDDFAVEGALHFIQDYFCSPYYDKERPEQPLLLKVSLTRPHYPYLAGEEKFCYYLNRVRPYLQESLSGHAALDKKHIAVGEEVTQRDVRRATAAYFAMIQEADEAFGKVVDALEQAGQDLDEWIVVFCADHGDMLGQHSVWMKHTFYEGSAHVPLFIRWPARFTPRRRAENVSLCDLYATLCEAAGAPVPDGLDSRSLLPLMAGETAGWDDESVSQWGGKYLMVKRGALKYQSYAGEAEEVLFDLVRDPGETRNFARDADYAQEMERFRRRGEELEFGR